jgi:hypothetical protein
MSKKFFYSMTIAIIIVCIVGFFAYTLHRFKRSGSMIYGVSFSTEYANYLGFDSRKVFNTIIYDWKFSYVRLSAQWDLIEKNKGEYDWQELDWMMNEAAANKVNVMLAVGHKTPRWPECHAPDWIDYSQELKHKPDLERFIKKVVERYKNHPALEIWQIENEPFLRFGDCEPITAEELQEEVAWVRSVDCVHPTIVTDSGELSLWRKSAKAADLFGTTLYRVVWNKTMGYWSYDWIMPAFVYKAKLWFNGRAIESAYITELQAEPWIPDANLLDTDLSEQFKSMSLDRLQKNIAFAERTGMPRAYLWGAEWWYWLASKNENTIPDFIKELKK